MAEAELLAARRDARFSLCARYGAWSLPLFVSSTRGEAAKQSDIDLLVELEQDGQHSRFAIDRGKQGTWH
jgi:predicted nucleotidyltransferase